MSDYQLPPPANPYLSPASVADTNQRRSVEPRPTICVEVFVVSLIFCLLRLPTVLFGLMMLLQPQPPDAVANPLQPTLPLEVLTGGAIVLFGLVANIALLLKQRWGVPIGYLTAVGSLANMGVALWQLTLLSPKIDDPVLFGVGIGMATITAILRLTIVGLYVWAIAHYGRWLARQAG